MRSLKKAWVAGVLAGALLAGPAAGRAQESSGPQLPQSEEETPVGVFARELFSRALSAAPPAVTPEVQRALLEHLPENLARGCREMIRTWGEIPENQPRWSVRVLHVEGAGEEMQAVLAFRCGSTYAEYENDFDERLAVLTLAPARASLKFLRVAGPCEECGELYRFELPDVFRVEQGTFVVVRCTWTNAENPGLGVIEALGGTGLHFLLLPEATLALSIETSFWYSSHDDEAGDSKGECHVSYRTVRGAAGRLSEVVPEGDCELLDHVFAPKRIRAHRWIPDRRLFESRSPEK
jgi:hypothetical protein